MGLSTGRPLFLFGRESNLYLGRCHMALQLRKRVQDVAQEIAHRIEIATVVGAVLVGVGVFMGRRMFRVDIPRRSNVHRSL